MHQVPANLRHGLDGDPLGDLRSYGLRLRARDYELFRLLSEEWQLPEDLCVTGVLIPWVEHGLIEPQLLLGTQGQRAAEIAEVVQLVAQIELRPSQRASARELRLFLLTCLCPVGAALRIGGMLARLRAAERPFQAESIQAAARAAARLGMWEVRRELLNRRVQLLDQARYRWAQRRGEETREARARFAASLTAELRRRFAGHAAEVQVREAQAYQIVDGPGESVWGEAVPGDKLLLLLDDVPGCYRALGILNVAYSVIGNRLRDYIGGPKENGYQAIHTCIQFDDAERGRTINVDVMIGTPAMERRNRLGLLADLTGGPPSDEVRPWWRDREQREALAGAILADSASLFVFTPHGVPIILRRGATVLDFAVRVHSDLGVYCRGALVNGQRTLPGEQLACGDICEVLLDQHNLHVDQAMLRRATTRLAQAKVRRAIVQGASGAERGRGIFWRVLELRLNRLGLRARAQQVEYLLQRFCAERGYEGPEAFYQAVARGEAAPDQAGGMIVEHLLRPLITLEGLGEEEERRLVALTLGRCCWPAPGAASVAALVAKKGRLRARIHRVGCSSLGQLELQGEVRLAPVRWKPVPERGYVADVLYEGRDEPGLIYQVTGVIAALGEVNITRLEATVPEPQLARVAFTCEASEQHSLASLVELLQQRPGKRRVEVAVRPLHDDDLTIDAPLFNPYSPQPSVAYPLFVGRDDEIRRIIASSSGQAADAHVIVRGPKRIGKSSLLENLARYHLRDIRRSVLLSLQAVPAAETPIWALLDRIAGMLADSSRRPRPGTLDAESLRRDPIGTFADFVERLRAQGGPERFAVLIDEFGLVIERFEQLQRAEQLQLWRGLLTDERVRRHISLIIAVPDAAAPQIGEICTVVRLDVLSEAEARDLIVMPVRTHLHYRPEDVQRIVMATGAHPFYTHLVCGEIVTRMLIRQDRTAAPLSRQVVSAEVVNEALGHIQSNEDAFDHVLRDSEPETLQVLAALAAITGPREGLIPIERVWARFPELDAAALARALEQRRDLLHQINDMVGIRIGLVAARLRGKPLLPPTLEQAR